MIRRLTDVKHIPKLVAFGRRFHALTAMKDIAFCPKRSEQLLRASMVSLDKAVWGAFINDKVVGLLIGIVLPWPYMEGSYGTDLVFCAESDGAALYRAFEQWALAHGANAIQVGVSSGMPRADAFYQAVGMEQIGGMYLQMARRERAEVAA